MLVQKVRGFKMQDFDKMYENMIADAVVPKRSEFSTYFAYRQGECKLFNTEDEAYNFSNLIEENLNKETYQKAMQDYYEKRNFAIQQVIVNMGKELGYNMEDDTDKGVLSLVYEYVYHGNSSATFNEIFNEMKMHNFLIKQVVEFMKNRVK